LPADLTILNEETTFKMEKVSAIFFAENTDSENLDIQQHFVGLMYLDED